MNNNVTLNELKDTFRRNKDTEKLSWITTIIGEVDFESKQKKPRSQDEIIKSFLKTARSNNEEHGFDNQDEIDFYVSLLPKVPNELSQDEIRDLILKLVGEVENPSKGMIMGKLKKIDGMNMRVASKIVGELL